MSVNACYQSLTAKWGTLWIMKSMAIALLTIAAVVLVGLCAAQKPSKPSTATFSEDAGYLGVRRDKVHWQSPESLIAELRSSDEQTRLRAMYLFGLTEQQAHHTVWSQSSPTKVIGQKVVSPDQIVLSYAVLGDDATQQAVIAVEDSEGQMTYAAVAIPAQNGWERIAVFDCWCKYEMSVEQDALSTFVQLRPAFGNPTTPQRYELVLRASGGGTGIYTRNEAHYRIVNGEVRRALSFVDSYRSCAPGEKCKIEKRWFYPAAVKGVAGGILVSAGGQFTPRQTAIDIDSSIRSLQNRYLGLLTCRKYKWNEVKFQYVPAEGAQLCENVNR